MTEQLSPDGQWRWDGTQWVPTQFVYGGAPAAATPPPATVQSYGPPPVAAQETDWMAILSLVFSLSTPFIGIGALVGIVLGHLARSNARKEGRQPSGLATAGLVIGYVFVALMVIGVIVVLAFLASWDT